MEKGAAWVTSKTPHGAVANFELDTDETNPVESAIQNAIDEARRMEGLLAE